MSGCGSLRSVPAARREARVPNNNSALAPCQGCSKFLGAAPHGHGRVGTALSRCLGKAWEVLRGSALATAASNDFSRKIGQVAPSGPGCRESAGLVPHTPSGYPQDPHGRVFWGPERSRAPFTGTTSRRTTTTATAATAIFVPLLLQLLRLQRQRQRQRRLPVRLQLRLLLLLLLLPHRRPLRHAF